MAQASAQCDVVIIGAGASGLMCAMAAGQRGRRVMVLDSSNKIGKKILMSGGGRCNFTNMQVEPKHFISENARFCVSALNRYTQWDFIALVEKHGIAYHERKHGQLFCDDSAKDILAMLVSECEAVGVRIRSHASVTEITAKPHGFTVHLGQEQIRCESLVVATGGLSIPTLGASGFGYEIARQFGHEVLPTRAGLVPMTFSDGMKAVTERLSGIALDSVVSSHDDAPSFHENMLFTHRGISGPSILQASNYWQLGQPVQVDLLPTSPWGEMTLSDWLIAQKKAQPKVLLRTLLAPFLVKALVHELQTLLWPAEAEKPMADWSDAALKRVAAALNNWTLRPSGTEGYRTAEVTLGGVSTNEVSSRTMESQRQAGLYFIGEVLDVTGWLGGYNFQWAWASGHAAGQFV